MFLSTADTSSTARAAEQYDGRAAAPLLGLLPSESNPREKSEGKGGVMQERRVREHECALVNGPPLGFKNV